MSLRARLSGVRLPRRTVRLRLALLFGLLFLVTGAGLLTMTYLPVRYAVSNFQPHLSSQDGYQIAGQGQGPQVPLPSPGAGPRNSHQATSNSGTQAALDDQKAVVLRELWIASAIALGVMAILSVVLGWIVAGRALRPLRTITAAAHRISATSLHERLALQGPDDELKELGDTFDGLLSRLQVSFDAQRRFVANASHELRTPLARQRALGQVALADPEPTVQSLRAAHERVLVAGAQQERLIEALLTLARGQAGIEIREPFDLRQLTVAAVTARQAEAQQRSIAVGTAIAPAVVAGHRHLAERLVTNLIDNALRHNHPGGHVDVATFVAGRSAVLTVANTGPPIPPESVDRLFQPFQRLEDDRTVRAEGLGLGLSIVEAIAQAHDGTVVATPRPGGGLTVTVTFPVNRAQVPSTSSS